MFDIDHDKLIAEVLDLITNERPPNTVTVKELVEQAQANGIEIARETIRSRLDKLSKNGEIEKITVGRNTYYRMREE